MLMRRKFHRLLLMALLCVIATPLGPIMAGSISAWAAPLSADELATVARVEDYLNQLKSLRSRFIQVNSFGAFAEGDIFLVRPGRLRFEYDAPHPILMIADGSMLLFYDKNLKQASFVPLSKTPLRFLTNENISLSDSADIMAVEQGRASLSISLQEHPGGFEGTVILVFGDKPLELRRMQIIDVDGVIIEVSLVNPEFGASIAEKHFDSDGLDVYKTRTERQDGR